MDRLNPLTIEILFRDLAEPLQLRWLAGRKGARRPLSQEEGRHGSHALIGHMNLVHPSDVQILGTMEMAHLRGLSESARVDAVDRLFSAELAALVVADDEEVAGMLQEAAERTATPLFASPLPSAILMSHLGHYLTQHLAETTAQHGVYLEVLGIGVLIKGDAGVGKSELALELVTRGHRLVADDYVELKRVAPQTLEGNCPPLLQDFLEVRGLGILDIRALFGETAVKRSKNLKLIVELVHPETVGAAGLNRLDMVASTETLLGVSIPKVCIPVAAGRNLAVLVEVAVRNHILKSRGINPLDRFIERQHAAIDAGG